MARVAFLFLPKKCEMTLRSGDVSLQFFTNVHWNPLSASLPVLKSSSSSVIFRAFAESEEATSLDAALDGDFGITGLSVRFVSRAALVLAPVPAWLVVTKVAFQ